MPMRITMVCWSFGCDTRGSGLRVVVDCWDEGLFIDHGMRDFGIKNFLVDSDS